MSQVDSEVDLGGLARAEGEIAPPRRGWLRIVLPLVIVGAFLFVLRDSLLELIRERPQVTLIRPVRLEGRADAGTAADGNTDRTATRRLALQAAGWVEPDPFPVLVPALSGGVVEAVLVQESDVVEEGAVAATLVPDDARLARAEAAARVRTLEAKLAQFRIRAQIAAERFDAGLEVTEAAAAAKARRQGREAEARLREAALEEGKARVSLAESEVVVQRELDTAGAAGARQVEIAEAELVVAKAQLASLEAQLEVAKAASLEAAAADERARADLELRFTDRLARDDSAAEVVHFEAELMQGRAALATAELRVARVRVTAPVAGTVLERLATAGDVLAPGQAVCSLYDPEALRVRVDVPQGDVEAVRVGQSAEVLADARPGRPYRGAVIRIVQRADIQKVTLEAQVRVLDADGLLRPDMLTQVQFFSAGGTAPRDGTVGATNASPSLRIAIPRRVVTSSRAWVFDPVAGTAAQRELVIGDAVVLGEGAGEEWVEVVSGLDLTDKVVDLGRAALDASGADGPVAVRVMEHEGGSR